PRGWSAASAACSPASVSARRRGEGRRPMPDPDDSRSRRVTMLRSRKARIGASLLTLALLASACSSRDDDDAATGDEGGDESTESTIPTDHCATDPTEEIEGDVIKLVSSYPASGQY